MAEEALSAFQSADRSGPEAFFEFRLGLAADRSELSCALCLALRMRRQGRTADGTVAAAVAGRMSES